MYANSIEINDLESPNTTINNKRNRLVDFFHVHGKRKATSTNSNDKSMLIAEKLNEVFESLPPQEVESLLCIIRKKQKVDVPENNIKPENQTPSSSSNIQNTYIANGCKVTITQVSRDPTSFNAQDCYTYIAKNDHVTITQESRVPASFNQINYTYIAKNDHVTITQESRVPTASNTQNNSTHIKRKPKLTKDRAPSNPKISSAQLPKKRKLLKCQESRDRETRKLKISHNPQDRNSSSAIQQESNSIFTPPQSSSSTPVDNVQSHTTKTASPVPADTTVTFSAEQKEVYDTIVNGETNVFFTGAAGTGKSVVLRGRLKENHLGPLITFCSCH